MTARLRMCRLSTALLAMTVVVVGAACGGVDDPLVPPRPAVELIAPAVEALETELGGPQEYFEINVDERLVNLFVAVDGGTAAVPYLYLDGEIQPPAPAQSVVEGTTFAATAIGFDPDTVLDMVVADLPTATMRRFVVLVGPEGAVRYEVFVQSAQGGQLAVAVTPDGAVLGVETL